MHQCSGPTDIILNTWQHLWEWLSLEFLFVQTQNWRQCLLHLYFVFCICILYLYLFAASKTGFCMCQVACTCRSLWRRYSLLLRRSSHRYPPTGALYLWTDSLRSNVEICRTLLGTHLTAKLGPEIALCKQLTLSVITLLDVAQNLRATMWGVKQLPEPLLLPVSVCATHPIAAPCTWTLWRLEYCSRGCFWSLLVHRTPAFKGFNFPADGRGEPVWSLVNICARHPAAKLIGSELQSDFRIVIILALAVVG